MKLIAFLKVVQTLAVCGSIVLAGAIIGDGVRRSGRAEGFSMTSAGNGVGFLYRVETGAVYFCNPSASSDCMYMGTRHR